MFLRDTDFITLADLAHEVRDNRSTAACNSVDVRVVLTEEESEPDHAGLSEDEAEERRVGTITVGKHEIAATPRGLTALAGFFDIPTKFLGRIPSDEQQFILEHRISRSKEEPLVVKYNDFGIREVYRGDTSRIAVADLVERLIDFLPEESQVVEWWSEPDDFRADVIVPEGFDRGIGGDRKIGDITHGGVRVGQNRKQNLAPWVQEYLFRLACTNGMEIPNLGLRIDARGADESEILAMFGSEAKRAFEGVEKSIKHFYDLRSQKIDDDRTGMLRRMSQEYGLPTRTIGRMEDLLPDAVMAEDEVTMFHLVNHITNQANNPEIRSRISTRRALERAGGQAISDHAARCNLCHSRLN
jgi:hypothetical protein